MPDSEPVRPESEFIIRQSKKTSLIIMLVSPLFLIGALITLAGYDDPVSGSSAYQAVFKGAKMLFIIVMGAGGLILPFYGLKNVVRPQTVVSASRTGINLRIYKISIPWTDIVSITIKEVPYQRTNTIKCLSLKMRNMEKYGGTLGTKISTALRTHPGEPDELNFNATFFDPPVEKCLPELEKYLKTFGI